MSIIEKLSQRPFFLSSPAPCPYLDKKTEQKIFTEITKDFTEEETTLLVASGFRRNNDIFYKQSCPGCTKCIPTRIPVQKFKLSKNAKRIISANKNLTLQIEAGHATDEDFDLFHRYQQTRHADSEMALMDINHYKEMIELRPVLTKQFKLYDEHKNIKAIMLCDITLDGYSAIYSFYDPDLEKKSLGKFMIYKLIEQAKRENKPYVYLGYWIDECKKMSYKGKYRPLEILDDEGWHEIS